MGKIECMVAMPQILLFNEIYKASINVYFATEGQITQSPSIIIGHVMTEGS
jgi:hypothetical protein